MMRWPVGIDAFDEWMAMGGAAIGLALLSATIVLIRVNYRDRHTEPMADAERELRLRLARGEISVEEFLRDQAALGHRPSTKEQVQ